MEMFLSPKVKMKFCRPDKILNLHPGVWFTSLYTGSVNDFNHAYLFQTMGICTWVFKGKCS